MRSTCRSKPERRNKVGLVEALLQQESLAKFAAFQNKQKARKGGHVNALKYAR